jgi:hypothetical protein
LGLEGLRTCSKAKVGTPYQNHLKPFLVNLCYPFDGCNLLQVALLYDTSCKFIVNSPIIYIPLHVLDIWGHVQGSRGLGETESIWYAGHHKARLYQPRMVMCVKQSVQ